MHAGAICHRCEYEMGPESIWSDEHTLIDKALTNRLASLRWSYGHDAVPLTTE